MEGKPTPLLMLTFSVSSTMKYMKGKTLMADKKHVRELGTGTAAALRLTAPWAHTGCIVFLDSAFASLKAAKALAGAGLVHGWLCKNCTYRISKRLVK